MAAHEQHGQGVVVLGNLRDGSLDRRQPLALSAGLLASPVVDQAEAGRPEQPPAWIRRNPVTRPMLGGGEQRLLDRVLGRVEVAGSASERAEDLRRQLAQQVLNARWDVQRRPPAV
jgi:hypothetical protein